MVEPKEEPTSETMQEQKSDGNYSLNNLQPQQMPSSFLVEEDTFLGRLGKVALQSYHAEGLDPKTPIAGVVLYVVNQEPYPEGFVYKSNMNAEQHVTTVTQMWVHTPYDEMCGVPRNFSDAAAGLGGTELLYEHFVYELQNPALQVKAGDVVEVLHPWAWGFHNTVGQVLRVIGQGLSSALTDTNDYFEADNHLKNAAADLPKAHPCAIPEGDDVTEAQKKEAKEKQLFECSWAGGKIMEKQPELVTLQDNGAYDYIAPQQMPMTQRKYYKNPAFRLEKEAQRSLQHMMMWMSGKAMPGAGGITDSIPPLTYNKTEKKSIRLYIRTAWRSQKHQTALWNYWRAPDAPHTARGGNRTRWKHPARDRNNPVAVPGRSNHQQGRAIDIDIGRTLNNLGGGNKNANNDRAAFVYEWMLLYAHRFGWYRTVCLENNHWEYFDQRVTNIPQKMDYRSARLQSWAKPRSKWKDTCRK